MRYAYLETNLETSAVDSISKSGMEASEVRCRLADNNLAPCFGLLTLNECAQAILSGYSDDAVSVFRMIRDLHPRFLVDPGSLYKAETRLLRERSAVDPFATSPELELILTEVAALSDGRISSSFLGLVQRRRQIKLDDWRKSMEGYLSAVKNLRSVAPQNAPRFGAFEQLEDYFRPDLARFIAAVPGLDLNPGEAELLAAELDRFPAIRGTVYFWWNAYFICLSDGRIPGRDKVDDWRHVVEASYCDVFITNDGQLLRSVPRLHRRIVPMFATDVLKSAV